MRSGIAGAIAAAALGCGATPAMAACTVGQLLELKVTMQGTRPMVPGTFDGDDERMLVDSGAFFSTIPSARQRRRDQDYDAALALRPRLAWSLYGRGLAKQRAGDKIGGDKDIADAAALDTGIAGRAKAIGLGG